jgi:autotransporter-associated beta strand protein
MTFANSALNYTLGTDGSGVIAGTVSLMKSGNGMLTLNAPMNTFSGGVSAMAGSLVLGADLTVCSGSSRSGTGSELERSFSMEPAFSTTAATVSWQMLSQLVLIQRSRVQALGLCSLAVPPLAPPRCSTARLDGEYPRRIRPEYQASGQNLAIAGNATTTISGSINTGSGALAKVGSSNLILSGDNTFSGGFTMSAGTVLWAVIPHWGRAWR